VAVAESKQELEEAEDSFAVVYVQESPHKMLAILEVEKLLRVGGKIEVDD
jgi:hypothetical protein